MLSPDVIHAQIIYKQVLGEDGKCNQQGGGVEQGSEEQWHEEAKQIKYLKVGVYNEVLEGSFIILEKGMCPFWIKMGDDDKNCQRNPYYPDEDQASGEDYPLLLGEDSLPQANFDLAPFLPEPIEPHEYYHQGDILLAHHGQNGKYHAPWISLILEHIEAK